jgi:hypothetical protein
MRTLMLFGILDPLASAESVVAAPDCHLPPAQAQGPLPHLLHISDRTEPQWATPLSRSNTSRIAFPRQIPNLELS